MAVAKKFSELRAKMSPESQQRAKALADQMIAEMPLQVLRPGDAFLCNFGAACGYSRAVEYQRRLMARGVCVDCKAPHTRGTWSCLACSQHRTELRRAQRQRQRETIGV